MADGPPAWLTGVPLRLHEPLQRAAAGVPANVALMQILMECAGPLEAERALVGAAERLNRAGEAASAARLAAVLDLFRANPDAFQTVRAVLGGLDHARRAHGNALAYWASAFDRLAQSNPEAGVALYSLGNADLLAAATGDVVERLDEWGLLSPAAECVDFGCGIGRLELALADRVGRIVGLDIAPGMVEVARRRTAHLANIEIRLTTGRDLAGFDDASCDLVLAVDVFPYLVQSAMALAETMVREAARVLRPGGTLVILNFSYRANGARDAADIRTIASAVGLDVRRSGIAAFALWDGLAYELRKP